MFFELLFFFKYSLLSLLFSILLLILGKICGIFYTYYDAEKQSVYECGFESFSLNPVFKKFEIEFLIISLFFLIFDLEIIFLLPWVINYSLAGFAGFCTIFSFLLILLIGFFIEYFRGVFNWNLIAKK